MRIRLASRRHAALALIFVAAGSPVALAQDTTSPPAAAAPSVTPSSPAPASPAPAPAPKKVAPPLVGTPATVMDNNQIESVLGKSVRGPKGDDMGRIVDVLIDRTGDVRAAVIDFGGFFGVGSRKIAVDWDSLHFKRDGKSDAIEADLPSDELRTAPVYKDGEPVVIIGDVLQPRHLKRHPPPRRPRHLRLHRRPPPSRRPFRR